MTRNNKNYSEINKTEKRKSVKEINKNISCFSEKINKIDKNLSSQANQE